MPLIKKPPKISFARCILAAFIENQVHFGNLGWLRITDAGGADPTWTWQAEDSTEVPCHRAGARQVEKFDQSPVLLWKLLVNICLGFQKRFDT